MAEDSGQTVVAGLFDHMLPLIDGLHEWLETGIDVLDVGRGRAMFLRALGYRTACADAGFFLHRIGH